MAMQGRKEFKLDSLIFLPYINDKKSTPKEFPLHLLNDNEVLFSFNEFDTIDITLDGVQYDVSIDCQSYIDEKSEVKVCDDMVLHLEPHKVYTISQNGNFDIGYNPGRYSICITHKNGFSKTIYFDVVSNYSISELSVVNLAKEIEKLVTGISLDFSRRRIGSETYQADERGNAFILKVLTVYYKQFEFACENVLKLKSSSLANKVVKDKMLGRQNFASIRKNLTSNDIYSVKKVLVNNDILPILKNYFDKIYKTLNEINIDFSKEISNINTKISNEKEDMSSLEKIINDTTTNTRKLISKQNELKSVKGNFDTDIIKRNVFIEWEYAYQRVYKNTLRVLNSIKFSNVVNNGQLDINFCQNKDYNFIKEFTNLITGNASKLKIDQNEFYASKKTSQIFELYGLVIIVKALNELGYELEGNIDFFTKLDSDSKFIFINKNKRIEVIYDHLCKYYKEAELGEVVNINSRNNKPDYILKYYNDNNLTNMAIVEMKYRSLKNYKDCNEGPLDYTVNDYYQLACFEEPDKFPKRLVSNVVIIYPSKEKAEYIRGFARFLSFNPARKIENNETFHTLKKLLDK